MNRQAAYRISLAVSDFVAGIIVFPSFIISSFHHFNIWETSLEGGTYANVIGFFTMLSLHVSQFTLVAASCDRFEIVYQPLLYNVKLSILLGLKICIILWITSIVFAALPLNIISEAFRYRIVFGVLPLPIIDTKPGSITNVNLLSFISCWYITLCLSQSIPTLWAFTVATFMYYKRHLKSRKRCISTEAQKKEMKKQVRLFITLGIMVGVFSVCSAPLLIWLLICICFSWLRVNISLGNFPKFLICSLVIWTSNSLWNFFIYSAREKAFRKSSKNLYKKLLCF